MALDRLYSISNFLSSSTVANLPTPNMPHADEQPMTVGEHPQCDPTKIRIVHVGMGASGMLCAHKARKYLKNYELVCYEKNASPGGTWW
jgi:hypothetical protein